jgi:D-alanyl-lipoteichoic acid acyltransferase DltB (MBOAT superfamily)
MGIAKLLGYELPLNFDAPYSAGTFREFWHRWHITLSTFLRDYLYIFALGGNRRGRVRSLANLGITMLLGGLWHGASWQFVIWGGMHGTALAAERLLGMEESNRVWPLRLAWAVTVQATVVAAWVMFRSPGVHFAGRFLIQMIHAPSGGTTPPQLISALVLLIPIALHHIARRVTAKPPDLLAAATTGVMAYLSAMIWAGTRGFIYFQF